MRSSAAPGKNGNSRGGGDMPQVFTHPRAEADLVDIWRYIAQDSPANADRMLDCINETLNRLAAMPFMGQARFDLAPGLRIFPVGSYLIFFRPIENGIEVIRVLHGNRNITGRFF
jgi:toxin ParE1/3/4